MNQSNYDASLTIKLYVIAGALFGIYGGRVCPMLETLTASEVFTHVSITFAFLFLTRHFLLVHSTWMKDLHIARLDTAAFFVASIPLALYYNLISNFPLDSNLKVLFGMALFGFFTGTILQLVAKMKKMDSFSHSDHQQFQLQGERQSMVKQMIALVVMLLVTLTLMLSLVALKDIFWLKNNPERIFDGTGQISVIKEFIYIAGILGGYAITIMLLWTKLMKRVLLSQECSLLMVTKGNMDTRLPVFGNDELGAMATLTNTMLDTLQSSQDEIKTTRDVAITSLAALAESRDNETGAHIIRTQEYVRSLAIHLAQTPQYQEQLTPTYIDLLYKSAPLHDVGKVGIPDAVLLKPGKLTFEEFEVMKQHPEIGAKALSIAEQHLGSSSFLQVAKEISLSHHEKWDGSGYPNGLSGQNIPLSGRLMAVADVYDALISKRVYKPAFTHDEAKEIIIKGKGAHFDPEVVDAFIAMEHEFMSIAKQYTDKANQEPNDSNALSAQTA
ncbi:HD domain-containing phosphohydrolase [Vibrio tapetis subsp. quintayensis]|uniref:HD domain-containing phosphohydrolase n=1 Tax=Vibrio tapetis TaxID=52443 RepID=UPI0025B625E7|nr:HD domain-containing phosphohydrolase [Vibrio tapetis]MDN3682511.1 HD domain-containing phosphohydrolase [Vibrio tapetis subsp. quintayensis]